MDKLERQRIYRSRTDNASTKRYEKTEGGFLMRLYRNMESRITGVQWQKFHLYKGKCLLARDEFYEWALNNAEFKRLFDDYKLSKYDRKLAPSVDRINPAFGYSLDNMEFVTHSENSRRGNYGKRKKINMIV